MEDKMEVPFTIRALDDDAQNKMMQDFTGQRGGGYVQVGPKNYLFPTKFKEYASKIYWFKPRSDDTWVVTFPRSGTTWVQELIWLVSNGLDFEKAKSKPLNQRFPFLEFNTVLPDDLLLEGLTEAKHQTDLKCFVEGVSKGVEVYEGSKSPRFFKTHLPPSLLHPDLLHVGAKVIYVARNPKDVAVSYFHFHQLQGCLKFQGDFRKFWSYFENGHVIWAPYWSHIEEGWKLRSHPNVCFLFYEDMVQDLKGTIMKICDFLNKKISGEEMKELLEHLHINNFRSNPSINREELKRVGFLNGDAQPFIREGKINGSQEYFSDDLNERAQIWIEENSRKIEGLKFPNQHSKIN